MQKGDMPFHICEGSCHGEKQKNWREEGGGRGVRRGLGSGFFAILNNCNSQFIFVYPFFSFYLIQVVVVVVVCIDCAYNTSVRDPEAMAHRRGRGASNVSRPVVLYAYLPLQAD